MADPETSCGLFSWRPRSLQRLADPRAYVALYFTIGVLQSTVFSYLSVVLSTVEKRCQSRNCNCFLVVCIGVILWE